MELIGLLCTICLHSYSGVLFHIEVATVSLGESEVLSLGFGVLLEASMWSEASQKGSCTCGRLRDSKIFFWGFCCSSVPRMQNASFFGYPLSCCQYFQQAQRTWTVLTDCSRGYSIISSGNPVSTVNIAYDSEC